MNLNLKRNVDPKLAKAIEEDMAELDKKESKPQKAQEQPAELVDCGCVTTGWKPGLIDSNTHCPVCKGSAKVPQVAEG